MQLINANNTKVLKALKLVHLVFAFLWAGGACAMMLLVTVLQPDAPAAMQLYARVLQLVDDCLIIPGALGCLLTGFVYAVCTRWGFVRHRWIALKWVLTVSMILSGTFLMGPCVNGNVLPQAGLYVPGSQAFWDNIATIRFWGTVQLVLLAVTLVLSVGRPACRR